MSRLVNKELLDPLNVVKSQETLLIFNENVDMAAAHISVSRFVRIPTSGAQFAYAFL